MDPLLKLLGDLVSIDSVNDPEKGKKPSRDCPDFIQEQLGQSGVESQVREVNGYYMVQGGIGEGKPEILLLGHWDVVPKGADDKWRYPPDSLTINGGRAYGRGAVDDKANVAAIVTALADLSDRVSGAVAFAFTGDEEIGGKNGAKVVASEMSPRYVINGDGLGLEIINRRRNYFRVEITAPLAPRRTRGEREVVTFATETRERDTRHSAYFLPGVDSHALLRAAAQALRQGLSVSILEGRFVKDNVIPEDVEIEFVREVRTGANLVVDDNLTGLVKALIPLSRASIDARPSVYGVNILPNFYWRDDGHHFKVDIRAMTEDEGVIRKAVEQAVLDFVPQAEIVIDAGAGSLMTNANSRLVKTARDVAAALGIPPRVVERQGASDSRYFSSKSVECIDFGPVGGNLHGPNEYVVIDSLDRLTKFYTEMVVRLAGEE